MEEEKPGDKCSEAVDGEVDDKIETVDVKIEFDDNPPEPEPEPEPEAKNEDAADDSEGHNEGNGSSENGSASRRRSARRHVSTPAYVDDFVSDTLLHIEPEGDALSTDSDDEYRPEYPAKLKQGKSNKKITPKRKFETMTFVDPNAIQSANGAPAASEDDGSQPPVKKKPSPDGAFTPLKIQSPSVFKLRPDIKKQLLQRPIPTLRFQAALSSANCATGWSLIRSTLKEATAASEVFHYKADNLTRTVGVKAVNNVDSIIFNIKKTLELLETSRNDVLSVENKFHRMIRNFVKTNHLEFHFNKVPEIRKMLKGQSLQQQPQPPQHQQQHQHQHRNDSDSDCEILEPKMNNELSDALKKMQQRGIIFKSTNTSTTLKDEHTISLPNKVIHFGKDIAIKRVSSVPKDHFFWLDGRTLKPPDSKRVRRPVELRDIGDFASWSSKIGWLDLAFESVGDRFSAALRGDRLGLYYTNCDVDFSQRIYLLSQEMYDKFYDNSDSCSKSQEATDKLDRSPPSLFLTCCLALRRLLDNRDTQNERDLSKLESFENRMKLYMNKYKIEGLVNYKMLLNKRNDTEFKPEAPSSLESSDSGDSSEDSSEDEESIPNEPTNTMENNLMVKNLLLLSESSSSEIDESDSEADAAEEPPSPHLVSSEKDDKIANENALKSIMNSSSSENEEDYQYPEVEKRVNVPMILNSINEENNVNADENHPDIARKQKKIRKILSDDSLKKETKIAIKNEKDRLERLTEKNSLLSNYVDDTTQLIVLDVDKSSKNPILSIHPTLSKILKAHQIDGVRFMWDSCFESVEAVKTGKPGSGSILAHCMGLGKTLQVITLIHTITNCEELSSIHKILILCPMSTLLNWVDEFKKWLNRVDSIKTINIIELSRYRKNKDREIIFEEWQKKGGVLLLGYEMFRTLINLKVEKNVKQEFVDKIRKTFINPGPDLVICDEGHLLKNNCSLLAESVQKILTKRRIVLTGTPLQNNLKEYYCMVNFVKPNLLGNRKEFTNRFESPIINGQHRDSNKNDIKLMKKRSHVLHKLLEGSVQRKEALILYECLPKKEEYVIFITLSMYQACLYQLCLDHLKFNRIANNSHKRLLGDFHTLYKIWTHPRLLIQDKIPDWLMMNGQPLIDLSQFDQLKLSHKFVVVFSILEECLKTDDKLVLFCTHLSNLDAIEYFLSSIKSWKRGSQYYRFDGSVGMNDRRKMCNSFNSNKNKVTKLLMLSTRVGGLGINLTGANRVIIMDVSWNPSHDIQSIFRVYRFGQIKPCYIYRLVTSGTMEEIIYERSVTKQAISCRVVDEHQIDRHYDLAELSKLYSFTHIPDTAQPIPILPVDKVLISVLTNLRNTAANTPPYIWNVHEHDSLLKNLQDEQLDEDERLAAWAEYEQEKIYEETPGLLPNQNLTYQPLPSTSVSHMPGMVQIPPENQDLPSVTTTQPTTSTPLTRMQGMVYIPPESQDLPSIITTYDHNNYNNTVNYVTNYLPNSNNGLLHWNNYNEPDTPFRSSVIHKTKHFVPIAPKDVKTISPPRNRKKPKSILESNRTPTKDRESIDLTNLPETPEAKRKRQYNKKSSRKKPNENDKNKSNTSTKDYKNNDRPISMPAKKLDFYTLPNIITESKETDPGGANLG